MFQRHVFTLRCKRRYVKNPQPRPQVLLLVQNGGRRNPRPRLPKWLQNFVRISPRKHDEMSSFCLNNGFRLQKTNRAARHWKQRPKKPFYHVSRDKTLHDSWSISAALARDFSDRHPERGEGPGDEVEKPRKNLNTRPQSKLKNPASEPPCPRAYNMQRFEFGHKPSGSSINTEDTQQNNMIFQVLF